MQRYLANARHLKLMPHAKEILSWAKANGFCNILASNKNGPLLREEVKRLGLADLFAKIAGAEDFAEDKPSKFFTDSALAGSDWDVLLSVGDGASDIQMARNYPNAKSILIQNTDIEEHFDPAPDFVSTDLYIENLLMQCLDK